MQAATVNMRLGLHPACLTQIALPAGPSARRQHCIACRSGSLHAELAADVAAADVAIGAHSGGAVVASHITILVGVLHHLLARRAAHASGAGALGLLRGGGGVNHACIPRPGKCKPIWLTTPL